jgi:hypothetical protein
MRPNQGGILQQIYLRSIVAELVLNGAGEQEE